VQRASSGNNKDRFERVITLVGNLTPEQRLHLIEIAERCPVSKTLRQSSDIESILAGATPNAVSAA
jgi:putative redox protein